MGIFFTITKVSCIWPPYLAATYCQLPYGAEKLGDLDLAVKLERHVIDHEWFSLLTEQRVAEAEENGWHPRTKLELVFYPELEVYKRLRGWKTGDFNSSILST